jgi:hypothetical protein
MPYRRLPKTDTARLKALKTVLGNDDIYAARGNFVSWKTLNEAQHIYDALYTNYGQYRIFQQAQVRQTTKLAHLQRNAIMYISHFIQVLYMSVERGEIKPAILNLYGLKSDSTTVPNIKTISGLIEWGEKIIKGEKERIKRGGRPIYNPTIGMVSTHYDIFCEFIKQHNQLIQRTSDSQEDIKKMRDAADETILNLWNQIEEHFASLPPEQRFNECRKYGVVYYYRRHEEHVY